MKSKLLWPLEFKLSIHERRTKNNYGIRDSRDTSLVNLTIISVQQESSIANIHFASFKTSIERFEKKFVWFIFPKGLSFYIKNTSCFLLILLEGGKFLTRWIYFYSKQGFENKVFELVTEYWLKLQFYNIKAR